MQLLLKLFISFSFIGIGAYGGGLVTIPLIQHELLVRQNWLTFQEMARLLAIAQMTPGPIAVNAATFVGYRMSGVMGSIVATVAVVLPSIMILVLVAPLIDRISDNGHVQRFRDGIQVGVLSLILFATWSYGSVALTGWVDLVIGVSAFSVLVASEGKLHPVLVILGCGLVGLVLGIV